MHGSKATSDAQTRGTEGRVLRSRRQEASEPRDNRRATTDERFPSSAAANEDLSILSLSFAFHSPPDTRCSRASQEGKGCSLECNAKAAHQPFTHSLALSLKAIIESRTQGATAKAARVKRSLGHKRKERGTLERKKEFCCSFEGQRERHWQPLTLACDAAATKPS